MVSPKKKSKVSTAASEYHLKEGASKYNVNRIAGKVPEMVARYSEEILKDIGEIAGFYASKAKRITILLSDIEAALRRYRNIIKVGKGMLE